MCPIVVFDPVDRLATAYVGPVLMARPEAFCHLVVVGSGESPKQIFGIVDDVATRTEADAVDDTRGGVGIVPCPEGMLRSEPRSLPPYTTSRLPLLALPSP